MLRSRKFDTAVELGIGDQYAAPGDHVAYFWETDEEFRDAIGFLEAGIRKGDHCVIFGFDEANTRVIEELTCRQFDCDRMKAEGNLTVLSESASGAAMLAEIAADFKESITRGAKMLRLLGNIGWGRPNWPADRDILEFEAHVTGAIADLPAVVVCMYDVQSLPGPTLLMGAFETHPLTIRRNVMRENEHYVPIPAFLRGLKKKR